MKNGLPDFLIELILGKVNLAPKDWDAVARAIVALSQSICVTSRASGTPVCMACVSRTIGVLSMHDQILEGDSASGKVFSYLVGDDLALFGALIRALKDAGCDPAELEGYRFRRNGGELVWEEAK